MKHYFDVALGPKGPVAQALVTVWNGGTNQTVKASIFSDNGVTAKPNPFATDALGNFDFYVADGGYDITFAAGNIQFKLQTDVQIGPAIPMTGFVLLSPSGDQTITSNNLILATGSFIETANAVTGTGGLVRKTSPTLTTPNIGAATGTSLAVGDGTAASPSFTFSSHSNTGLYNLSGSAAPVMSIAGSSNSLWFTNEYRMNASGRLTFSSNSDPTLAAGDAGISRTAAATLAVGNGTQGDASGTILASSAGIGASPNYPVDINKALTAVTLNIKANVAAAGGNYGEIAFQTWSGAGSGLNTFGGAGTSRPSVVLRGLSESASASGAFVVATFAGGADNTTLTEKFRIPSTGGIQISGSTSGSTAVVAAAAASGTLTLPSVTDTITANAATQTLTNKTISSASNTLSVGTATIPTAKGSANQLLAMDGTGTNMTFVAPTSAGSTIISYQGPAGAITGTGAFANVYTFSIPANTIPAGKGIRLRFMYSHTTGTQSVSTQVVFGATTVLINTNFPNVLNGNTLSAEVDIFNNAGVQNAQNSYLTQVTSGTSVNAAALGAASAENTGGAAVSLSVQFSVANTDQITPRLFLLELIQ